MTAAAGFEAQLAMLLREVTPSSTFVQLACGDARIARALAPRVRASVGVDETEPSLDSTPPGFRFARSDGATIPLAAHSADLVYAEPRARSWDQRAVLAEIRRVLRSEGRFVCVVHEIAAADAMAGAMRSAGLRDIKLRSARMKLALPLWLAKAIMRVAPAATEGELALIATK